MARLVTGSIINPINRVSTLHFLYHIIITELAKCTYCYKILDIWVVCKRNYIEYTSV